MCPSPLPPTSHTVISLYYNMLFVGHSLGGIIAVSQLAHEIYINVFTDVRLPDKFQREIDDLKREICEQLVNSESHRSLYETRALTQTVSDCRTSLKELEQLLKDRKIDDGTTLGRISQLKMRLYVSRTNIERLKTYSALCVSQRQALSLSQKRLLVPDDASAILRTLVEEPIDVPISDTAGSMDDRRFIYRSDKNLGAMRGPHKTWLEGRDNDTSLLWVPESPGSGKSTTFPAFIDYGLCTTFMTTTMYCYPGLGDQELCDNSMHSLPTDDRSHDLFYLHGLDKGAVIASSSLSETRSSLNDLYVSCTVCHGTKYNSPFSTHKGFSYRSWANLGSTTTISSATIRSSSIWSDDTPRPWFLRRWLLQELVHAMSSVSLRTSKILTLVSPIFFTSPASAEASHCGSQNDTVRLKTEPRDYNSWSQALNNVQRDLLYVSCILFPPF